MERLDLKALRDKHRKTQQAMADLAGVSFSTYHHWEKGSRQPSLEGIVRIAKGLEVSLDDLFGRITSQAHDSNEERLLTAYRQLDVEDKSAVMMAVMDLLLASRIK